MVAGPGRREAKGVSLTPRPDLAIIAVQGPDADPGVCPSPSPPRRRPSASLKPFHAAILDGAAANVMIARTGYTGEDGFEVVLPAKDAEGLWSRAPRRPGSFPAASARATRCASRRA